MVVLVSSGRVDLAEPDDETTDDRGDHHQAHEPCSHSLGRLILGLSHHGVSVLAILDCSQVLALFENNEAVEHTREEAREHDLHELGLEHRHRNWRDTDEQAQVHDEDDDLADGTACVVRCVCERYAADPEYEDEHVLHLQGSYLPFCDELHHLCFLRSKGAVFESVWRPSCCFATSLPIVCTLIPRPQNASRQRVPIRKVLRPQRPILPPF